MCPNNEALWSSEPRKDPISDPAHPSSVPSTGLCTEVILSEFLLKYLLLNTQQILINPLID